MVLGQPVNNLIKLLLNNSDITINTRIFESSQVHPLNLNKGRLEIDFSFDYQLLLVSEDSGKIIENIELALQIICNECDANFISRQVIPWRDTFIHRVSYVLEIEQFNTFMEKIEICSRRYFDRSFNVLFENELYK